MDLYVVEFTALLVTSWNIPKDSITSNYSIFFLWVLILPWFSCTFFNSIPSWLLVLSTGFTFSIFFSSGNYTCFFFYFIASWIGFVLGFFRTGSPSFTWGVVFLLVSHLFGFSVSPPRHHLTYPPPTRFGAFAATLIQLFPHTLILTHIIIPHLMKNISLLIKKRIYVVYLAVINYASLVK